MSGASALAVERQRGMQSLMTTTLGTIQGLWRDATPDRILGAMQGSIGTQILNAVIAGQLSVVGGAQAFVSASMLAQGVGFGPAGRLVPSALAGISMDGRPLATLLQLPAITTARALAYGESPAAASLRGLSQMAMITSTTLADTSRVATHVAMTAEPRCVSYVRVVPTGACGRCIILAGREYSYSTGFARHPHCKCSMAPRAVGSDQAVPDPKDLFEQMTPDQRRKAFGAAGAEAIANGADIGRVVNARRGMSTAARDGRSVRTTTEGTHSRRGIAGQRGRTARLMPEEIMQTAKGRDAQIKLLRENGYLT